jgi:hypothetical protein
MMTGPNEVSGREVSQDEGQDKGSCDKTQYGPASPKLPNRILTEDFVLSILHTTFTQNGALTVCNTAARLVTTGGIPMATSISEY